MEGIFRRISFAALVVAFLTLVVFLYLKVTEPKPLSADRMAGIPMSAILIAEFHEPAELYRTLQNKSEIWSAFIEMETAKSVDRWLFLSDSISKKIPTESESRIEEIFLAMVPMLSGGVDFLLMQRFSDPVDPATLAKPFINDLVKGTVVNSREYDGVKTLICKKGELTYYVAFLSDVLLSSPSQLLLEEAIRLRKAGESPLTDSEFAQVAATAGHAKPVNLYLHPGRLFKAFEHTTPHSLRMGLPVLSRISGWVELDAVSRKNAILLNGYGWAPDTLDYLGGALRFQRPGKLDLAEVLPVNTAVLWHLSVSDLGLLRRNAKVDKDSSDAYFESWAGGEMAAALIDGKVMNTPADMVAQKIIIAQIADEDNWIKAAQNFIGCYTDSLQLSDTKIYKLHRSIRTDRFFGEFIPADTTSWVLRLKDYAVFSASQQILTDLETDFRNGNTLNSNEQFREFLDNLNPSSHYTVYIHPARYVAMTTKRSKGEEKKQLAADFISSFNGFAWQFVKEEKQLIYQSAFLRHGKSEIQKTDAVWEVHLDDHFAQGPWLFLNHINGTNEVLVQDELNTLYLLDKDGQILWRQKLDGPILSRVHIIDRFKNKKFQMVFNTPTSIWQLDRNGQPLEAFPLSMKKTMTLPITLADYDNARNYRIFADQENQLVCLDITGAPVKGWNYKSASNLAVSASHVSIKGKDYIMLALSDGSLLALDRHGKPRLNISEKVKVGEFWLWQGNTHANTEMIGRNIKDRIQRINLEGKVLDCNLAEAGEVLFIGSGKDRRIATWDKQHLKILNAGCDEVETSIHREAYDRVVFYETAGKQVLFWYNHSRQELVISDLEGNDWAHPPYPAKQALAVQYEKKEGLNLITCGPGAVVRCFKAPN